MKRFWHVVTIGPVEGGHVILLDSRPMRLPGGPPLIIGPARLALAIAEEWQMAGGGYGGEMSFSDTPLTRLAGTAQERIAPDPTQTIDAIARYAEADLLCYRAAAPIELVQRQMQLWQRWLDWAALTHDAPLRVTTGISYIGQHQDSIAALKRAVARMDAYALAGLGIGVPALGSLVLGLAMATGELDGESAATLGALDELFQVELWGDDTEAAARRAAVRAEIVLAARFIALTRGDA